MKYKPLLIPTKSNPIPVVVISLLPDDQQEPLSKWLYGQTIIMYEKHDCAYYWDYERWYDHWIKGEEAEVYD